MVAVEWLSSPAFAAALVIGVGYLFRDGILRYVTEKLSLASKTELQSRQHQFEQKLDEVRRDFQSFQLTQKSLLTSFLEISSERAKAVSKREIEAAEAIWASVDELNQLLLAATTADLLKFDAIESASAADREKFKEIAKVFTSNLTPEFIGSVNCQWTRLYVNETAWAFYHAYSMILITGAFRMMSLETGIPVTSNFDKSILKKAILEALPHQKSTFEKFPDIGSSLFLDELRQALMNELRKSIHGEQSTEKEAERARAILNALPKDVPMPSEWQMPST